MIAPFLRRPTRQWQELRVAALLLAACARAALAQEPPPPTSEEAQEAFSRFATSFVSRLADAQQTGALTPGKYAEINEFAHRQPLRGCDERRTPEPDPFAPAPKEGDAPAAVVFQCTWASGERISLTRIPNTGSWVVSDDAAAAAGAGMILAGARIEAPRVASIPVAPLKAEPPAAPLLEETTAIVASYPVVPQPSFMGTNMQAMPSPFVPAARSVVERPAPAPSVAPGPMPVPFTSAR